MTPQVYRKRRQLTLIALEIKRNTVTIKESDLAPWTDDSAFLKAFKREFNITPHKYIKEKDFTLQEKIEIPLLFHLVMLFLRYVEREIRKLFD